MHDTRPDPPRLRERPHSAWLDYAFAVAAVAIATVLRVALAPVLGDVYPFITYFGAVAGIAWFGRTSTAIFTLVVSGVLALYLFVPPPYELALTNPNALFATGLFFAMAGVVVAMGHATRAARYRAERLLAEAIVRQDELGQAVMAEAEQRERLRTTLSSIGDAVITTDTAGRVTNLNPVAEALTGWTNAEAAGQPLDTVFHIVNETTRRPVENPAARALKEGVIVGLANHTVLIGRDNTERPIDDSAAPIRSATGEILGCVLVFRDITERHHQDAVLRASEARFRELADALPQMVYESDAEGRVVYASRQWLDYTGQRDAQTADLGSVVHPDDLPDMVQRWDNARATGMTLEAEFRLRRAADQTYRWFLTRSVPVRDGDGQIIKWFGTSTDIHKQKEIARRLAESEALYRAIGESIDFGVWVCDAEGRNTYASDSFLRLVGITQQECSDFGWGKVLHPDDAEATMAAWKECVRTKGPWDRQHRFKGTDGRWYDVLARGVPLKDDRGEVLGWAGINLDISRLVHTEQEVARLASESERQRRLYETVLTNTPDFMYVFSLDHRVLYANDALIKMWGRGVDGAIGKTFLEIGYEPWHADMHDREIDQVRRTRQPVRGEVPFTGTHGRRLYDYIFVPVIGADGEVEAVAGTTRDVTDRKEAERAVRAGEERLRTALAAARMVAWEWTPSDRTLRVSENAADVFGLPAGVGLTGIDQGLALLHPDDVAAYKETFRKAIAERAGYFTRYRLIRPSDGEVIWIEERGQTVFDQPDEGARLFGVSMDVTDRLRTEEAIGRLAAEAERERRLFAAVLSNTPDFIYTFNLEGRFVYVNSALLALWGRRLDEAVGRNFFDLDYPHDLADRLQQQIQQVIDTRQPVRDETPYTSRAGERMYEYIFAPVFGAGDTVEAVAGSTRDITERKLAEAERERLVSQLRDQDRRKDEFLATLAHELRNPLAPIRNGLQVIRMAGADGTIEQVRSMMERQVGQMTRLVDDLLDVSRVTSGKLQLRRKRVELRTVIDAAVETSRPAIELAGHELSIVVPEDPLFVDGDAIRLAQVVSNLLTNSARYTHPGGHIRVVVRRDQATAVVTVTDDGVGIPPGMLEAVFGMFTQVDRTLEKTTGGLGIGLSLAKGVVEMHGGTIAARSDGDGRGSTFEVRLPVASSVSVDSDSPVGEAVGIKPSSLRRILVVDDNVDAADSLAQLLEMIGNDVRVAYDGAAGIEAARTFRPVVVFCDIGMPKVNGYDVARHVRNEAWGQEMVLVALTGWGQDDDRQKSADAGFDRHLVKPVEDTALMKLLGGLPTGTD
jgi:PAS domain S-box-containing protein